LTPTARSLAYLRRCGYTADITERWLPIPGRSVRRDLFGCIDLLGIRQGIAGVLGIQATTAKNVPARLAKARKLASLATWLRTGNAFEVWGWSRIAGKWQVRRVAIRGGDLCPEELERPARGRRRRTQPDLFALAERTDANE